MEKLTKEEKEKARKLAEDLNSAFYWGKTKQGKDYWQKIESELLELANQKVCPHCGKEIVE